jgi:protein FrlC
MNSSVKFSVSSIVYQNYTLEDAIQLAAEAGYQGIDIWGGRPHAYFNDRDDEECRTARRRIDHFGLGAPSFIPAQFRYPTSLCSPIDTIRESSIAYIQGSIVTAAAMGISLVSVCPGHSLNGQGAVDGWERLKDSLARLCSFAVGRNIRVALEPADRYETDLVNTVGDAARMIAEVDCANLGVLLDSGHVHVTRETMAEAFQNAADRLYHIHIDDNNGMRDQHLVPGNGSLDFAEFFELVRKFNYTGYLCAELSWDYTIDPQPAVCQSIERLRKLML